MPTTILKMSLLGMLVVSVSTKVLFAQRGGGRGGGGRGTAPAEPAGPAPRLPNGQINLGPVPGEMGLWEVGPTTLPLERADVPEDFGLFAGDMREPTDPFLASRPKLSQIPFQPWARALFADRVTHRREPYTRCKPSPAARQVGTAYGTQILQVPELQLVYILETGGAHSFRTIYMDGRSHPTDGSRSGRGHSIGHWEGDALVVDTTNFDDSAWIDNLGPPTTEKLHTVERFTRTDANQIRYEITIDDPGAYTAPWSSGFYMRWTAGAQSFEFVCQDNNKTSDLMVGDGTLRPDAPLFVP